MLSVCCKDSTGAVVQEPRRATEVTAAGGRCLGLRGELSDTDGG